MARTSTADMSAPFSDLVERVQRGEEVVIARDGEPVAKIVPVAGKDAGQHASSRPLLGALKGKMWVADDFDAPLPPDIQAYFEGEMDDFTDQPVKGRR